jgi:hypothetical protein
MRKKSPATIQKWVDSISVDESESSKLKEIIGEDTSNCDTNEAPKCDEASTSGENLKVKLNEICSKLSAKGKRLEFKNLLKLKRENSMEQENDSETENHSNLINLDKNLLNLGRNCESSKQTLDDPVINPESLERNLNDSVESDESSQTPQHETSNLTVQRCPLGVIGRSSSENPPRNSRLNDIGRSFSVVDDNELKVNSSENLIYDADEDISITIPSLNTSPSIVSNNTNHSLSNSQLPPVRSTMRSESTPRSIREHTVSEGHQSPQIQPRNPLLRDSSFQVGDDACKT